jgi:glycerate dehydrogenase
MEIVFLDESTISLGDLDFSALMNLGSYRTFSSSNEEQIIDRAKDAYIIIANKAPITRKVLSALPKLKLVTLIATGYNNVDLQAASEMQVRVCNVSKYASIPVAQHTFGLLLNLATKLHVYHQDVQAGKWQKANSFTLLNYRTFELSGKTIGIVGFGAIGHEVAKIARAFGMHVLVHAPSGIRDNSYPNTEWNDLLRASDVVTLHCPLTARNRNLIDQDALAKMKKTALLINTARGGLVDEKALFDALQSGTIAGAGMDVLSEEPPVRGNILLGAKNILISPHSAWSTVEARQRLIDETVKNIQAFLAGEAKNVVS